MWAVLTAAGFGTRLGSSQPKALVDVGGESLLRLALARLLRVPGLCGIAVTCPQGQVDRFEAEARGLPDAGGRVRFVEGGASRQASVLSGLLLLDSWRGAGRGVPEVVLVHDAARPLAPTALMSALVEAVEAGSPAVIPGVPVADTIKKIAASHSGEELVEATLPRAQLRAAQTPQAFDFDVLLDLHVRAEELGSSEASAATDDAALAETAGLPVQVIPGSPLAFKVTTPADLQLLFGTVKP